MILQLYIYNCQNCSTSFKSPELPGEAYGEFLMRSESGEMAYLSSFKDIIFEEVENLFKKNKLINSQDQMSGAKIFHKIFGIICDLASDKSEYQMGREPNCPKCHSNRHLSWRPINPPELIDIQINPVTHNIWNKYSNEKKEEILNNAIKLCLKVSKSLNFRSL